ncbi:multidrug effflux MFS transporter [Falsiroseomonas ponticola]|jgi:DHA1 family bicyclomycin/chloramphenicol resistance-like MFS transporter|uniref:multidrug effflux MFS transporter n=1 Tax=Falsiroseomonas ponticola TaxID=2786951 RepID=UPI00193433DE|nr:multidrug effflux MFS transporter [Roseomonas ponticola]
MPEHYRRLAILLGALTALGPLGVDMYLPAFPAMGADLGAGPAEVQRTLATFLLGMALGQLAYGPLADRVGRRIPMMVGLALFILASIGCALARSAESLAWLRLLQALGGCVGTVVSRAVVRDLCDERGAVRMMSLLMLAMGAAPILAPMFGGWMLLGFGWRGIFWFLALYGLVALAVLAATLPESLAPEQRRRDGPMAVLSTYVSILRDRRFLAPALASSVPMAGLFAYLAGSPIVLMDGHGLTPTQYGMAFGANALALIAASQVTARLVRRHAPAWLLPRVLVAQAVAGVLALAAVLSGLLVPLLAALFLYLGLLGATLPLAGALAMQPMGRVAGSASALMGTIQFGLGALVGAVMGAIGGGGLAMGVLLGLAGSAGLAAYRLLRR